MTEKRRMPAELLAHFKSKGGDEDKEKEMTPEEKKEGDKTKRKEALQKARTRMEEKSKRSADDKKGKAG